MWLTSKPVVFAYPLILHVLRMGLIWGAASEGSCIIRALHRLGVQRM